jgi:hypothetical protein
VVKEVVNLNNIHPDIQFTMETKFDGHLSFLDIDIYSRPDGYLGDTVYSKVTHTDFNLNAKLHHHPVNKHSMLGILAHRVRAVCNQESPRGTGFLPYYVQIEWLQ